MSTKTFGRPVWRTVLYQCENGNCVDMFAVALVVKRLLKLASSAVNKKCLPCFLGPYTVNRVQGAKKSHNKNIACPNFSKCRQRYSIGVKILWVETFVTPGLTTKIMKISTPRK